MRPARSAISLHERTMVGRAKLTSDTVSKKMEIPEAVVEEAPLESLFPPENDQWASALSKAKQTLFDVPPPELAALEGDAPQAEEEFPVEDTISFPRLEEPNELADAPPPETFSLTLPDSISVLQESPPVEAALPEAAPVETAPEAAPVETAPEAAPVEAAPQAAPDRKGEILVVFGCRGGAGATTLTVNLAGVLAKKGRRVAVVDLDLQLGDVFVTLDLEADTSIAGLSREVATLDEHALLKKMKKHPTGFYALTQTGRLDDVDGELADRLPDLLDRLKRTFDVVIIDGVRDFDDYALAALDVADHIALVVTQDVPSVRRAARVLALCRKLKYSERKLRVVVNRAHKKAQVPIEAVEKALALPVRAKVANDWGSSEAALTAGELHAEAARKSRLTADVAALADVLITPPAALTLAKPGFWARFFRKKEPSCA